jgi:hypothetical protein
MTTFANAIITPVPNWEAATFWELVVWGACMGLAALGFGLSVLIVVRASKPRWGCLLMVVAGALFVVGLGAATRGDVRYHQEQFRQWQLEREQEKAKPSEKVDPDP